jgi:hypothetical protein
MKRNNWLRISFFIVIINGCAPKLQNSKDSYRYNYQGDIIVDSELKHNHSFAIMDSLPEIPFVPGDYENTHERKRSSMVIFQHAQITSTTSFDSNAAPCHVFWIDSNELDIRIGLSGTDDSASKGIWIPVIKSSYVIQPYHTKGGGVYVGKGYFDFNSINEKLVLDKVHYFPGDSLYGFVQYDIRETTPWGDQFIYKGNGIFRAKVREL